MPAITGSFSGHAVIHGGVPVGDQDGHQMLLARMQGSQASPDPNWAVETAWDGVYEGGGAVTG